MMGLVTKHFDSLEFVKKSIEFGTNEQLAEYQARQIEKAIEIAINSSVIEIERKEFATTKDIKGLELKIEQIKAETYKSKYEIIVWVGVFFIASGFIQHFFK